MPRSHNLEVREPKNFLSARMSGFKSYKGLAFWVKIPAAARFLTLKFLNEHVSHSSMSIEVTLEDCGLEIWPHKTYMGADGVKLHLELPKMLDLTGLPSDVPTQGIMHERFVGRSGELYVACDWHARFWPREYLERSGEDDFGYFCNVGTFVSMDTDMKFQRFRLTDDDWIVYFHGLKVGADKTAILDTIDSQDHLQVFFQRFFEWVSEFAQTHGEKRYLDRETYWRNIYSQSRTG